LKSGRREFRAHEFESRLSGERDETAGASAKQ
jgi:hypothetical protein